MPAIVPRDARSLAGLTLELARTASDRRHALELLRAVYIRKRLLPGDSPALKALPQALAPGSATFLASRHGELAGTISVFRDSPAGLPIDTVHRADIDGLREAFSPLVEVGSLATNEEGGSRGVAALLFLAAFRWAVVADVRFIVACVHPSHRRLYGRWLGFETLGECLPHPRFLGSPSIPIGLDLRRLEPSFGGARGVAPDALGHLGRLATDAFDRREAACC